MHSELETCRVLILVGDPIPVLVGKRCLIAAILVPVQIVIYGPVLKAMLKVRPISGKLGIGDVVVVEELENLVVEHLPLLPRVCHVGEGAAAGQ